ncbi:uncharacterized protein LOC111404563 [Olea europaea var. sylvestris]|uniref:uncharacterized protein LOC111404563 n=1 Tax=Olea europaea var. sylvestris TaxID=158386 RepID=UPI000C1CFD94|nr:uncharacterized protein LOC111404563 [Olea europaea var. sylvestris]
MKISEKEAFRKPMIQKNEQARHPQGRYCRYHRMVDHDTDNCRELKEEIESLTRRGWLQEFIAKPKEADRPSSQRPLLQGPPMKAQQTVHNRNPPPCSEIKMMVRRNQYIEGSKRAKQRQARNSRIMLNYEDQTPQIGTDPEWLWFTEKDSQGILQNQSDALVVNMPIARVSVHRTLVDNGSSINILYSRTLRQLEISERYLQPYSRKE